MFMVCQCLVDILDYIPSSLSRVLLCLIPWPKIQRLRRLVGIIQDTTNHVYEEKILYFRANDREQFTSHEEDIVSRLGTHTHFGLYCWSYYIGRQ